MPTTESTTTDRSAQQEAHKRSLFISREEVARALGIGRTTVWKLTKAAAQGDDQSLQNVNSVGKKAHIHISFRSVELLG